MIIKERMVPKAILQLEAILRRIAKDYAKRPELEIKLRKRKAGYKGELQVDYYLSFLPEDEFIIICDLKLKWKHRFQIDTLLVCRFLILIIETKNIAGKLTINSKTAQMKRTYHDIEEVFSNPLLQAKRHQIQLQRWMDERKLPRVPIEYLAVVSSQSTLLDTSQANPKVFEKMIMAESLLDKIEQIKSKYQTSSLSKARVASIIESLLKGHDDTQPNILKENNVSTDQIIKGVQCPECGRFKMKRISANWKCPHCHTLSKTAHQQALTDYFLLISQTITNRQFRDFLDIDSDNVAYFLLKNSNLKSIGAGKGKRYYPTEHTSSTEYCIQSHKTANSKKINKLVENT